MLLQLTDIPDWHPVKLPAQFRIRGSTSWTARSELPRCSEFCMPHQVVASELRFTVNYTMFEAAQVPASWVTLGHSQDLVIVPTHASRDAWLASGYPAGKVGTCPLGVDVERFHPAREPAAAPAGWRTAGRRLPGAVLNVSEPSPRKNLTGLIRTWISATSANDDAILIIKCGPSTRQATTELVRQLALMEQSLGRCRRDAAPIVFVDRLLTSAEMPGSSRRGTPPTWRTWTPT